MSTHALKQAAREGEEEAGRGRAIWCVAWIDSCACGLRQADFVLYILPCCPICTPPSVQGESARHDRRLRAEPPSAHRTFGIDGCRARRGGRPGWQADRRRGEPCPGPGPCGPQFRSWTAAALATIAMCPGLATFSRDHRACSPPPISCVCGADRSTCPSPSTPR